MTLKIRVTYATKSKIHVNPCETRLLIGKMFLISIHTEIISEMNILRFPS